MQNVMHLMCKGLGTVVVALGALSSAAFAAKVERCDEPTPVHVYKVGDLYGFTTTVNCYLKHEDDDKAVKEVVAAYKGLVKDSRDVYSDVSEFSDHQREGWDEGYYVYARELVTSSAGPLDAPSDIFFLSRGDDKAMVQTKSKSIKADGHAGLTKFRDLRLTVEKQQNHTLVSVALEVHVERPCYALIESAFTKPAKEGIASDSRWTARGHADRVAAILSH